MAMCLVQGQSLGAFASSKAPELSLNTLHCIVGITCSSLIPKDPSLSVSCSKKMTSCNAIDKAMYSALVVNNAIMVCIFDNQMIGQPVYIIM